MLEPWDEEHPLRIARTQSSTSSQRTIATHITSLIHLCKISCLRVSDLENRSFDKQAIPVVGTFGSERISRLRDGRSSVCVRRMSFGCRLSSTLNCVIDMKSKYLQLLTAEPKRSSSRLRLGWQFHLAEALKKPLSLASSAT